MFTNPPDHTRLRRLTSEAFTPRHVELLRTPVGTAAEEALDQLADRPGADFMRLVALPLPAKVIAGLLGVPDRDYAGFAPVVREMVEIIEPAADLDTLARAVAAQEQLAGYLADLLAAKRRQPTDGQAGPVDQHDRDHESRGRDGQLICTQRRRSAVGARPGRV